MAGSRDDTSGNAATDDAMICVGAIAGAFGVHGAARLKSFTADPADIADYAPLVTGNGEMAFDIRVEHPVKNGLAVRLSGIETREAAEALRGQRLYVPRARLPALPDDEFYHADLIGLEVVDTGGAALGRVRAVHDHGAGDLLEIHAPGRTDTVLLPFTRAAVPTVDLAAGRIVADPPEGLF